MPFPKKLNQQTLPAMVFSSNVFLLYFMPVFFLVYFILPKKTRNYTLLFGSLLFYLWGAPEFIIQLILSLVANFYLVRWMCHCEKPRLKKLLCGFSIAIPIGLLLFYKYGNFTIQNISILAGWLRIEKLSTLSSQLSTILLPIGISFFSFQSVTYTLDTYRGVNQPMKKLSDFMYEARARGLYRFVTDNGAGGLSSSVGEMAEICGGCRLEGMSACLK